MKALVVTNKQLQPTENQANFPAVVEKSAANTFPYWELVSLQLLRSLFPIYRVQTVPVPDRPRKNLMGFICDDAVVENRDTKLEIKSEVAFTFVNNLVLCFSLPCQFGPLFFAITLATGLPYSS